MLLLISETRDTAESRVFGADVELESAANKPGSKQDEQNPKCLSEQKTQHQPRLMDQPHVLERGVPTGTAAQ